MVSKRSWLLDLDAVLTLPESGVGGREGAFSMCTFWLVEALTRAGAYDKVSHTWTPK